MAFGLSENDIGKICEVLATFPQIKEAVIYGSRAKGNFRKGSDIDLTLFGEELNTSQLNSLVLLFEESDLPYLFDLSIYDQLQSDELKTHIQRIGKRFYFRG